MLKQLCVSLAALSVATVAAAADITNPFYLPGEGQVGSITSVGFGKMQMKQQGIDADGFYAGNSKSNTTIVNEEMRYGLTDTLALIGSIGNTFLKEKGSDIWANGAIVGAGSDRTDENMSWSAGLAWNIFNQAFKLQAKALYLQDKLYDVDGEYKSVVGEVMMGYQFDKMLPYVSVGEEMPVAQVKGTDKPIYNAKIGLYQGQCETWGLDTGIRWIHSENGEYNTYNAEVEASYYLSKNSAVSVYGTYALDGRADHDRAFYDKSIGARLRWFF